MCDQRPGTDLATPRLTVLTYAVVQTATVNVPRTLSGKRPPKRVLEQLEAQSTALEAAGLDGVCTIPEAMRLARVSRRTIYHWITKNWVAVRYTPSGHLRVVIASLQQSGEA